MLTRDRTTADFLTSVADKNARNFQPGKEETTPKTPQELEEAFRRSRYQQRLLDDVQGSKRNRGSPDNLADQTFKSTAKQCELYFAPSA